MIEFPVAISSHSKCFICKNILKSTKLHSVSHNTVKRAFNDFKIILKPISRCCGRHIDHNKNLKEEEYSNMRTKIKSLKKRDMIIFKKTLAAYLTNSVTSTSQTISFAFKLLAGIKNNLKFFTFYQ